MAYERQKQWDEALRYYEQGRSIRKEIKDRPGLAWVLRRMADVYIEKGDKNMAEQCESESRAAAGPSE